MLGNTLVLPLTAGDQTLPLIPTPPGGGTEYYLRTSLVSYRVQVRHSNVVRAGVTYDRHNVTMTRKTFVAGAVPEFDNIVSCTITCLPGDTYAELYNALCGWLESSVNVKAATNAVIIKLLGWEG
jgi:hypothetical protein